MTSSPNNSSAGRRLWSWICPLAILFILLAHSTDGARVLMVTLGGTKSHKIPFLELGRALTRRGHSVTLMSAFPSDDAPLPNAAVDGSNLASSHLPVGVEALRRLSLSPALAPHSSYGNSTGDTSLPGTLSRPGYLFGMETPGGFLRPPPPSQDKGPSHGIVEIAPPTLVQFVREFTDWDLLGRRINGTGPTKLGEALQYAYESCKYFLGDPVTRRMIQDRSLDFDLLVADGAFPDCIVGFAHRFRVPFMYINTVGFHVTLLTRAGNPVPYSVTPFFSTPYNEEMNFFERVISSAIHASAYVSQAVMADLLLQRIVREAFGPDVPNIVEQERNVSFILQNAHASVSYARPYLPLVAEVACIHCKTAKPLPADLEEFVSGGPEGFIYFSMGSSVRASNMPPHLKALFVEAFARLAPIRVLWKWEDTSRSGLPENIMVSRWLPQQDILGHPRIRAFVTHGGLLSMYETVFHGVPVVTMPVFCDHDSNAAKAEMDGYAIKLELKELTADTLLNAIKRIMFAPEYRENVHRRSLLLRDQPESPLDRAVYWTEYIIRHRGAPHLQSPVRYHSVIQAYGVDIFVFYLIFTLALVTIMYAGFRFILPRMFVAVTGKGRKPATIVGNSARKVKAH